MESSTTGAHIPPTYTRMLEEVGRQLGLRKSDILKRSFLISWPFILLFAVGYIVDSSVDIMALTAPQMLWGAIGLGVYVLLSIVYTMVVRFIFEIEKRIWVDSFFDGKNLSPQASWSIARKLFWPAFMFRLYIYLRYSITPIFLAIMLTIGGVYVFSQISSETESQVVLASCIAFFGLLVAIIIYAYYLKIKLRYTWFIFLDMFGLGKNHHDMVDEMNTLNTINKSDSFKKALVADLGTASVQVLAQSAISTIGHGMGVLGGSVGRALGGMLRIYGEEASHQAADVGNIAAQYIIYRFARKVAYGEEQVINEKIYSI